ncbi:hypothetical protein [Polaribacter sp. L3A8]|nr:hypothetical protein [Polaribacter sp. L3A8]
MKTINKLTAKIIPAATSGYWILITSYATVLFFTTQNIKLKIGQKK